MIENGTADSERARILRIRKILRFDPTKHLVDGYEAVAVHSNSILIEVNQACANIFGYAPNELVCMNAWAFFPPESVKVIIEKLVAHSEEAYQVMAKHRDGALFKV